MALPIRTRPGSPTVSLSHQEASISFLSLLSEGRQNENHNHSKLIKLITWTTALSNSVELWAMSCRSTYDRWVLLESSDKMWSPGEGNGKLLQNSCLENPMNSITFILSLFNNGHLDLVATKLGKTPNSLQPSNQEVFREKRTFLWHVQSQFRYWNSFYKITPMDSLFSLRNLKLDFFFPLLEI